MIEIGSSRRMLAERLGAVAVAAVLALSLVPGASAQALEASSAKAVEPQAATKTVYVVSKDSSSYGAASKPVQTVYSYDKNGLVTKRKNGTMSTTTYKYDSKKRISTVVEKQAGLTVTRKYSYNKKGYATSATTKYNAMSGTKVTASYNKAGRLVKRSDDSNSYDGTFAYDKNGRLVSYSGSDHGYKYSYDKKGNVNVGKTYIGSVYTSKFTNTYNKKGLLTRRAVTGGTTKTTYTYKAIKVPANMVAKVKAQQWAILNYDNNFAFGFLSKY